MESGQAREIVTIANASHTPDSRDNTMFLVSLHITRISIININAEIVVYASIIICILICRRDKWSAGWDSNPHPTLYKNAAQPIELPADYKLIPKDRVWHLWSSYQLVFCQVL